MFLLIPFPLSSFLTFFFSCHPFIFPFPSFHASISSFSSPFSPIPFPSPYIFFLIIYFPFFDFSSLQFSPFLFLQYLSFTPLTYLFLHPSFPLADSLSSRPRCFILCPSYSLSLHLSTPSLPFSSHSSLFSPVFSLPPELLLSHPLSLPCFSSSPHCSSVQFCPAPFHNSILYSPQLTILFLVRSPLFLYIFFPFMSSLLTNTYFYPSFVFLSSPLSFPFSGFTLPFPTSFFISLFI